MGRLEAIATRYSPRESGGLSTIRFVSAPSVSIARCRLQVNVSFLESGNLHSLLRESGPRRVHLGDARPGQVARQKRDERCDGTSSSA